jgi:hypothetical protein
MHGFRWRQGAAALLCLDAACGSAPQPAHPVSVRLIDAWIEVHNARPDFEARFLTFERRGEEVAYGVYGAHAAKSSMRVPTPLGGDPIAWPDRDHVQALAYLLDIHGMDVAQAEALSGRGGDSWFAEGLRVFVLAPDTFRIHELAK